MTEKLKKATRSVAEHVARARAALDTFEVDQQSGVLPRPTLQAAAITMTAEVIERTGGRECASSNDAS